MRYQLSRTGVRTNVSEMMGLPTRAVVECVRFHALMPIEPPNRFKDPTLQQIDSNYDFANSSDSFPSGFDINNSAHYGDFHENRYLVIGGTPQLPSPSAPSSVSSNIEAHRQAYTVPVYGVIVASTQPI